MASEEDAKSMEAATEGVPDAVGGEEVTAEGEGPAGASGEEGARPSDHEGAGGDEAQPANKKPPPAMPVWRTKRPRLVGSKIRALFEENFDQASEAFESMCVLCSLRVCAPCSSALPPVSAL